MAFWRLFLFCSLIVALLGNTTTQALTKEEILSKRDKRIKSLKASAAMLREQINKHLSGEVPLNERDYNSKIQREAIYKSQILDLMTPLTDEEINAMIDQAAEL